MHADAFSRLKINMRLYCLGRIHMNGLHEPARFVCSDWQERQIDRAESQANVAKEVPISCVAGEKNALVRSDKQESAPERAISIQRTSRGEMLCRRQCDRQR